MDTTRINRRSEEVGWMFWKKRRYVVAVLLFIGCFCSYMLRVNLSVAIVDMTETKNITLANGTTITTNEFDWDTKIQGYILSSFFYGYAATQLVGGYLAARYGGKIIFGTGIAITAFITIVTPWIANSNVYFLLGARTLEGLAEGITTPCIYEIWSKWAPPLERTRLTSLSISGMFIGTVVCMPLSGYLVDKFGWSSVFYSYGAFSLIWYLIWMLVVANTPQQDKRISYSELKYITESLNSTSTVKLFKIPWKQILTSVPVWATMVSHFTENWGFYTLLTQLPKFMKRVLKFDLNDSGFLSALPYLVQTITFQASAQLADWFLSKNLFTTTQVRKIFTCIGFLIQTVFMMSAAFWLTPVGTIVCLTAAIGLGSISWNGFNVGYIDLAPKYASVILGLGNTFSSVPGIISPILSGYIVINESSAEEWRVVFFISSGLYLFGAVVYGIFASSEEQTWATNVRQSDLQEGYEESLV